MSVLHVTRQGAELRLRGELIEAWEHDQRIQIAQLPLLEGLALHGGVHLTTPLIGRLLARGIDCVFLTQDGRFKGRLESLGSTAALLRSTQARAAASEAFTREAARAIVRHKLITQARVLRALRCDQRRPLDAQLARLREAENLAEIRGLEGFGSRQYFGALRRIAGGTWTRERRPAPDGINALLSYGYAILESRVFAAVATVGLDPYIGFLHEPGRPRPAFVLDMMEEFRAPLVDFTVFRLFHALEASGSSWWTVEDGGARLSDAARTALIRTIETRLTRSVRHRPSRSRTPFQRVLELQVRGFAGLLSGRTRRYRPYAGQERRRVRRDL